MVEARLVPGRLVETGEGQDGLGRENWPGVDRQMEGATVPADERSEPRSAEVIRRRLLIAGTVQGVGFRAGCSRAARRAGVSGHAANLDDGRVEVVVEGPARAVEEVTAWCRTGPSPAQVQDVTSISEVPTGFSGRFATH